MKLFSKPKSYLGVDIGSSSLKVVELTKKANTPQLVTYGYSEEPTDIVRKDSGENQAKTAQLLQAVCEKAKVGTKKTMAALPNFFVFSSIINLPAGTDKKELESAINWEAKKIIPIPIEEVVLDWKILSAEEKTVDTIISNYGSNTNQKEDESPAPASNSSPSSFPEPFSPQSQAPNSEFELNPSPRQNLEPPVNQKPSNLPNQESNQNKVIKESPQENGLNILLTAAPKNLIKKYIDICQAAGLELLSLETESFALSRSLIGCNPHPVMLIDMGALVSDIVVLEKGIPVLSRSIDVGGVTITQSIMNILNINVNRAEQFKRDFGAPLSALNFGTYQIGHDLSAASVPRAISTVLDSLMHEIRYSLNLYQNQTSNKVEKVILAGGSAFLPHFTTYLSQTLALPVHIGNPWDRLSYPTELKPILENLAPRFAVAVGLAMREII